MTQQTAEYLESNSTKPCRPGCAGRRMGIEYHHCYMQVVCRASSNTDNGMQEAGMALKKEDYTVRVPRSQRGGEIVEPLLREQWFVRMQPLAEPALQVGSLLLAAVIQACTCNKPLTSLTSHTSLYKSSCCVGCLTGRHFNMLCDAPMRIAVHRATPLCMPPYGASIPFAIQC